MAAWMLCALAPGLALCCAALLADQAGRQRRWPGRWIWLAAMLGSILLPLVGPAFPPLAPLRLPPVQSLWPSGAALAAPHAGGTASIDGASLARGLWIGLSAMTLAFLAGAAWLLRRRARRWRRVAIAGCEALHCGLQGAMDCRRRRALLRREIAVA